MATTSSFFCASPLAFRAAKRVPDRGAVAAAIPSRPRTVVSPVRCEASKGPAPRGSTAAAKAGRNPLIAAASNMTVIPGDYRIGGVLLGVATFLGPVCHLWTQFGVHGAQRRELLGLLRAAVRRGTQLVELGVGVEEGGV